MGGPARGGTGRRGAPPQGAPPRGAPPRGYRHREAGRRRVGRRSGGETPQGERRGRETEGREAGRRAGGWETGREASCGRCLGAGATEVGAAELGEWGGWSHPGPFERRIFCLSFGSELVVGPGSDTVLTQRRSDPADRPGATRDWHADVAQLVEHHLAKVRVAGSNPVVRSEARLCGRLAAGQPRSCGGVAEWLRQGPAKPCTRVRFPSPPPENL
jgi:hypothetical protein